jgi:hypothetical protein
MDSMVTKPTLIFFQVKYHDLLPKFVHAHQQEHVKCLSQFFNVVVVRDDCDYAEVCDKHQPDLAMFESGIEYADRSYRPKVSNTRANPAVLKIGFLHADAFSAGRAGFLSDMDHLGIETFFAIATTAAENTPSIAESLFIWPNFVDPDVYKDYGLWKSIPILFTGNVTALYPWRQKLIGLVSKYYPCLTSPHSGFDPKKTQIKMPVGESYARMLNSSMIVPSCGTIAKEVVRKHFEIPACNALLIAEPSKLLEAAGFTDMVNCVFAEEDNVLDKLSFLFDNPDAREQITRRGFELVHLRHTIQQRDQIFQWYKLNKATLPHQKIVQENPFGPLQIVDRASGGMNHSVTPNGLHLNLLREGDRMLTRGDYDGAERHYTRCAQHIPWMPEPKFRLALLSLRQGKAKRALLWILELIQFTLVEYGAADPDPVEWAYFLIATVCVGKLGEAVKLVNDYPDLRHLELDRARRAVIALGDRLGSPGDAQRLSKPRNSTHQMAACSEGEWLAELAIILSACNQGKLAAKLRKGFTGERGGGGPAVPIEDKLPTNPRYDQKTSTLANSARVSYFRRRLNYNKSKKSIKLSLRRTLYHLEGILGYFLPHHLSSSRQDELYKIMHDIPMESKGGSALVLADWRARSTQALIAGFQEAIDESEMCTRYQNHSRVFCLGQHPSVLEYSRARAGFIRWYGPAVLRPTHSARSLKSELDSVMMEANLESFDIAFISSVNAISDEDEEGYEALYKIVSRAREVLLEGVNRATIYRMYSRLLRDGSHWVTAENPSLRNGYAVLHRV